MRKLLVAMTLCFAAAGCSASVTSTPNGSSGGYERDCVRQGGKVYTFGSSHRCVIDGAVVMEWQD